MPESVKTYEEMFALAEAYNYAFPMPDGLNAEHEMTGGEILSRTAWLLEAGKTSAEQYPVSFQYTVSRQDGWVTASFKLIGKEHGFLVSLRGENGPVTVDSFHAITPESDYMSAGNAWNIANIDETGRTGEIPGFVRISMRPGLPNGAMIYDNPSIPEIVEALEFARKANIIQRAYDLMDRAIQSGYPVRYQEYADSMASTSFLAAPEDKNKMYRAKRTLENEILEMLHEYALDVLPFYKQQPAQQGRENAFHIKIKDITLPSMMDVKSLARQYKQSAYVEPQRTQDNNPDIHIPLDHAFWTSAEDGDPTVAFAAACDNLGNTSYMKADPKSIFDVRPLAIIESMDPIRNPAEGRFFFGGHTWTTIWNGYAICDDPIGKFAFSQTRPDRNIFSRVFAKNMSVYDASDVKKSLHVWAEMNHLQPGACIPAERLEALNMRAVKRVAIMTGEEYKEAEKNIPKMRGTWWLRPSHEGEYPEYVENFDRCTGASVKTDLSLHDYAHRFAYHNIRPALMVNAAEIPDFAIGKTYAFTGKTWTAVSDKYLLCNGYIGEAIYAKNTLDYDKSILKARLDAWTKENGIRTDHHFVDAPVAIRGVSMLSKEELQAFKDRSMPIQRVPHGTGYWWLAGEGMDNMAWCCHNTREEPYNYTIDLKPVQDKCAVRPVLDITGSGMCYGNKILFAGHSWTVITAKHALCDDKVGITKFNDRKGEAVYERSSLESYLGAWAYKHHIPVCAPKRGRSAVGHSNRIDTSSKNSTAAFNSRKQGVISRTNDKISRSNR